LADHYATADTTARRLRVVVDGNVDQPLPPHATLNILEAVNREGVDELLTMANVVMGLPVMASWVRRRALVFFNHANILAVTPRSTAEYTWAAGNGIVG
jgi:hypothetical protein